MAAILRRLLTSSSSTVTIIACQVVMLVMIAGRLVVSYDVDFVFIGALIMPSLVLNLRALRREILWSRGVLGVERQSALRVVDQLQKDGRSLEQATLDELKILRAGLESSR
jgi:hypothetical protein